VALIFSAHTVISRVDVIGFHLSRVDGVPSRVAFALKRRL